MRGGAAGPGVRRSWAIRRDGRRVPAPINCWSGLAREFVRDDPRLSATAAAVAIEGPGRVCREFAVTVQADNDGASGRVLHPAHSCHGVPRFQGAGVSAPLPEPLLPAAGQSRFRAARVTPVEVRWALSRLVNAEKDASSLTIGAGGEPGSDSGQVLVSARR